MISNVLVNQMLPLATRLNCASHDKVATSHNLVDIRIQRQSGINGDVDFFVNFWFVGL